MQQPIPEVVPASRGIYCNRTLNLRSIKAVGYDMDYTLIHYNVEAWEERAYAYLKEKLLALGWPVEPLTFDHRAVDRGLIVDRELGNIVKANRFGYVKAACHGTRMLDYGAQRRSYARTVVDLAENRWRFLNTSFSVSEGCMYRQLVDLLDRKLLPGVMNYSDLYNTVRRSLDEAHMEGRLKADIVKDPDRFIDQDPEVPLALLDQKMAGKKMLLITNSGWPYTQAMMSYAFNPHLPDDMVWQELFDIIIVAARKPAFFSDPLSAFEVVDFENGLLDPVTNITQGKVYHGGNARLVEQALSLSGKDILYIGDHAYGDVRASKSVRRWRTALVLRELEEEIEALGSFQQQQKTLTDLMERKIQMERRMSLLRLNIQRKRSQYGPQPDDELNVMEARFKTLREEVVALDQTIAPIASAGSQLVNSEWGLLLRAGNDKSYLARTLERHADIYTSRVSNFLYRTPYSYIRSPRGSLPHDLAGSLNPYQEP